MSDLAERIEKAGREATEGPWEILGDGRQVFNRQGCVAKCDTQWADDDDEEGGERDWKRAEKDAALIVLLANSRARIAAALRLSEAVIAVEKAAKALAAAQETRSAYACEDEEKALRAAGDAKRAALSAATERAAKAEGERDRYMERFDKSERQRLEAEARSSRARGLLGEACHAIREEVCLPIIRVIGDMERVGYPKSETQKIRDALHRLDQSVYEVDYQGKRVEPDTSITGAIEAALGEEHP